MKDYDLKLRTKKFALCAISIVHQLPNNQASKVLGNQLLRAATSVGANYRSARRSRSTAEFISKLNVVEEEADECVYWLELLEESGISNNEAILVLKREAHELTAIFTAAKKTAKTRKISADQT